MEDGSWCCCRFNFDYSKVGDGLGRCRGGGGNKVFPSRLILNEF